MTLTFDTVQVTGKPIYASGTLGAHWRILLAPGVSGMGRTSNYGQARFCLRHGYAGLKVILWRPVQEIIDLEDGGCLWQAKVAEWPEMLPWIRAGGRWGDVRAGGAKKSTYSRGPENALAV